MNGLKKNSTIRNEAFDLRNYANAAIEILNPNLEEMNRRNLNGNIYIQAPRITKRKRKYGR